MNNIEKLKQFLATVVVPDLEKEIDQRFREARHEGMMSIGDREERS